MVKFDISKMVAKKGEMVGIKSFKLMFSNENFVSVIGGESRFFRPQGDGIKDFELGYLNDSNLVEVEPFVSIERVNEKIDEFIEAFGQPVELNGVNI